MGPWIQVSGMSPRTTGNRAFLRPQSVRKNRTRRPMRIFTPQLGFVGEKPRRPRAWAPFVVAGMDEGQPRAIRPISGGTAPAGSFGRYMVRRAAIRPGPFPPEEEPAPGGNCWRVSAERRNSTRAAVRSGAGSQECDGTSVIFASRGMGQAGRPREARGKKGARTRSSLEELRVQGEGQGVDDEAALIGKPPDALLPFGGLPRQSPDLGHRPPGRVQTKRLSGGRVPSGVRPSARSSVVFKTISTG